MFGTSLIGRMTDKRLNDNGGKNVELAGHGTRRGASIADTSIRSDARQSREGGGREVDTPLQVEKLNETNEGNIIKVFGRRGPI